MRMLVIASIATLAFAPTLSPALAGARSLGSAGGEGLAAHRAVYDLTLKDASERSGINGMVGRMVYEFGGSACEGYTVSFRFVTEFAMGDETRVSDQQTTTFEDIRTPSFRFVTRHFINQTLEHEIRGSAQADDDGVDVTLEKPDGLELEIEPAFFPTHHMIEMIEKARSGERFYESRIYDGSDEGNRAMITTTILGEKTTANSGDLEAANAGELADEPYWPVSMSYFEENAEGDGLPVYSIAFKLYDNGVTRDLTMDYGDYVLEGKLAQLDMYETDPCAER